MHAVTLDELANVVSLSPYHFQRQFKAHFHVTPHQMLMAIRLWRAKGFLTHGMPAAEVAAATGLTDQSHLTRAFTRRYGLRLSATRNKLSGADAQSHTIRAQSPFYTEYKVN